MIHPWLQRGRARLKWEQLRESPGAGWSHTKAQAYRSSLKPQSPMHLCLGKRQPGESPQGGLGPDPGKRQTMCRHEPALGLGSQASEPPPDFPPQPPLPLPLISGLPDTSLPGESPLGFGSFLQFQLTLPTEWVRERQGSEGITQVRRPNSHLPVGARRLALDFSLLTWATHPDNDLQLRIMEKIKINVITTTWTSCSSLGITNSHLPVCFRFPGLQPQVVPAWPGPAPVSSEPWWEVL